MHILTQSRKIDINVKHLSYSCTLYNTYSFQYDMYQSYLICFFLFSPLHHHFKHRTIIGGIEKPKHPKSIIGLFRRESSGSTQGPEAGTSDSEGNKDGSSKGETSSIKELTLSHRHGPSMLSKRSTSLGGPSVLLMEDVAHSDPLGASSRPASIMQGPHRGQCRRGSMLELTGFVFNILFQFFLLYFI